jgi:hypothetical protein
MFDSETQEALEQLSEESLFKVAMMIKKLAKKGNRRKPAPQPEPEQGVAIRKDNPSQFHSIHQDAPTRGGQPMVIPETRVNLFDNMAARNEHKEDSEFDKAVAKYPPTPRSRGSNLVSVVCCGCGRSEEVSGVLLTTEVERYTCNTCQVRGKKRR